MPYPRAASASASSEPAGPAPTIPTRASFAEFPVFVESSSGIVTTLRQCLDLSGDVRQHGYLGDDEPVERLVELVLGQIAAHVKKVGAQKQGALAGRISLANEKGQIGFHHVADGQHRNGTAQGPEVGIPQARALVRGMELTQHQTDINEVFLEARRHA